MSKIYIGKLKIIDKNGEIILVSVHRNGKSIYLSDSQGQFQVHVSREKDENGWLLEYHTIRGTVARDHEFIPAGT